MTRTVLFVCQANMLRSAAAEALTNARYPDGGWTAASAGVRAFDGAPMDPAVHAALAARGIDGSAHRSRQLTIRLIEAADLVLTFETGQRSWAAAQLPRKIKSIHTIRRAAAILRAPATDGHDADGLTRLTRSSGRYGPADDFTDPVGTGTETIAAAVDEIESLLATIIPALGTGA